MFTQAQIESLKLKLFSIATVLSSVPTCYSQASKYLHWCKAMEEEIAALIHTGT